jgi:predicted alpha/beta hydrolase
MHSKDIQLQASDGYSLAATWYEPAQPTLSASGRAQVIVIGSATAVPRGFYKRFCEYACRSGLYALATDYRGIGDSKSGCPDDPKRPGQKTLKGFVMDYADWSTKDLGAAVQYASEHGEVYLVGHSLGGHAIGQLPAPELLKAAYVCGTGAGWAGWMPPLERVKVALMWNVLGPLCTALLGYHAMSKFGLGEDIPYGVYRDWKRWCALPHYFFDDPAADAQAIVKGFDRVHCAIAAAVSTDDLWAPPKSRDAFFSGYQNAALDRIDLKPQSLGVASIGHMGYFRKEVGAQLWPQILDWLSQHGLKPA